jgi:hypothetical protein
LGTTTIVAQLLDLRPRRTGVRMALNEQRGTAPT